MNFQVLKATTMNSVIYLQELKTRNTQVDLDFAFHQYQTAHISDIDTF